MDVYIYRNEWLETTTADDQPKPVDRNSITGFGRNDASNIGSNRRPMIGMLVSPICTPVDPGDFVSTVG